MFIGSISGSSIPHQPSDIAEAEPVPRQTPPPSYESLFAPPPPHEPPPHSIAGSRAEQPPAFVSEHVDRHGGRTRTVINTAGRVQLGGVMHVHVSRDGRRSGTRDFSGSKDPKSTVKTPPFFFNGKSSTAGVNGAPRRARDETTGQDEFDRAVSELCGIQVQGVQGVVTSTRNGHTQVLRRETQTTSTAHAPSGTGNAASASEAAPQRPPDSSSLNFEELAANNPYAAGSADHRSYADRIKQLQDQYEKAPSESQANFLNTARNMYQYAWNATSGR